MLLSDPPRSYEEIRAVLRIPVGSIGPQRARCLDRLRKSIASYTLDEGNQDLAETDSARHSSRLSAWPPPRGQQGSYRHGRHQSATASQADVAVPDPGDAQEERRRASGLMRNVSLSGIHEYNS
jgi:hypothetical protein